MVKFIFYFSLLYSSLLCSDFLLLIQLLSLRFPTKSEDNISFSPYPLKEMRNNYLIIDLPKIRKFRKQRNFPLYSISVNILYGLNFLESYSRIPYEEKKEFRRLTDWGEQIYHYRGNCEHWFPVTSGINNINLEIVLPYALAGIDIRNAFIRSERGVEEDAEGSVTLRIVKDLQKNQSIRVVIDPADMKNVQHSVVQTPAQRKCSDPEFLEEKMQRLLPDE